MQDTTLDRLSEFPDSPTEGQIFWHDVNKRMYLHDGTRWRTDTSSATFVVAASDSINKEKADYVCDGIDDQEQIHEALASLPARKGKIALLEGTYYISETITITDDVSLVGQQCGTYRLNGVTRLEFVNGSSGDVISVQGNNVWIQDLSIEGNKANCPDERDGIHISAKAYHPSIQNVAILRANRDGVHMEKSSGYQGTLFTNVWSEYNNRYAFHISGIHGYYSYLLQVQTADAGSHGIYLNGAERSVFVGSHSSLSHENGWHIVDSKLNFFIGCGSNNAYRTAFYLENSHRNVFDACWIYNPSREEEGKYTAFVLDNSQYNVVTGFEFYSDADKSYGSAIVELNSANSNTFKNNVITSQTGKPIVLAGDKSIARDNQGCITENSGTATFSGDGQAKDFRIAHGLDEAPTFYNVREASPGAGKADIDYIEADATNIIVHFESAPAEGKDNVRMVWMAHCY